MSYQVLKYLHLCLVILSASGFVVRGISTLRGIPLLRQRWQRALPHFVDTLLLISGLMLVSASGGVFLTAPWLHAKLSGLLAYIVLGSIALRRGKTRRIRALTFVAAVMCLGWMASVALLKSPLGIFGLLPAQGL